MLEKLRFFSWLTILLAATASPAAPFAPGDVKGSADGVQSHFQNAQKAQKDGDLFRAESEYRQSLGLALERLGSIYNTLGDLDHAAQAYNSAVQATVDSEGAMLGLGVVYLRKGEYKKGVEVMHILLAQNAFNPQARDLLGKLLFAMNRFDAAAQELGEAARLEPGNISASFTLALIHLKQRQPEKARKIFDQLQKELGDSARLHVLFGGAYRQADLVDDTLEEFKKAAAIDPHYPRVHYYLGLALLNQKETFGIPEAVRELNIELHEHPDDYLVNSILGVVYLQDHKYPEAIPVLENALRLGPDKPESNLYLGQAFYLAGQQEKAIPLLRRAIELTADPSRDGYKISNGYYMLGQALVRKGKTDEARHFLAVAEQYKNKSSVREQEQLKAYLQSTAAEAGDLADSAPGTGAGVVVITPPPPSGPEEEKLRKAAQAYAHIAAEAYNQLGLMHASQSDFKRAAQNFSQAALWGVDVPDVDFNLGLAEFKAQDYAAAIAPLERVKGQHPERTPAVAILGMSYFFNGDYQHAVDVLLPLQRSGLKDAETAYGLGLSLVYSGHQQQGEQILRDLIGKFPQVADAHLALGQALALSGDYTGAGAEFSRALELDPALPEAHYFAGLALLRQSKSKEAEQEFRKEIERNPKNAKAMYHLGLTLTSMERLDEALRVLTEAIQLNPAYADAYYEIGKVRLQQGHLEEAIKNLEKAAQLGDRAYVQYQLSQAYLKVGRTDAAQTALARYRDLKAGEHSATPRDSSPADPLKK